MAQVSEALLGALESDCATDLEYVIKEKKQEDFEVLQGFLSLDPSISSQHRTRALYALGRWGNPVVVDNIRRILPDLDEAGRISAVDALGRLGTHEALEGILNRANDPSPQVRKVVVYALSKSNALEARVKLREIATRDPIDYVRERASKYIEPSSSSSEI